MALHESINKEKLISILASPGWPEFLKHLDNIILSNYKKTGKKQKSEKGQSEVEFAQDLGFSRGIIWILETLINDLERTKKDTQEAKSNVG